MTQFIVRRLIGCVPVLVWITIISFGIIHLAPGKPTDAATSFNPKVSLEARQRLEQLYGLDQPLPKQYARWVGRLVRLDFGRSFVDDRPVMEKILERLPITLDQCVFAAGDSRLGDSARRHGGGASWKRI